MATLGTVNIDELVDKMNHLSNE